MDNRKKYLRLKMNYTIAVSHPVKWQYQDGTVNDVQINCANGQKIMVNNLNQYAVNRYTPGEALSRQTIIVAITFHLVYRVDRPRLFTTRYTLSDITIGSRVCPANCFIIFSNDNPGS